MPATLLQSQSDSFQPLKSGLTLTIDESCEENLHQIITWLESHYCSQG
ncbi:MAG: hypothetical protein HQL72_11160 [Magnetococcales bacterium]|nr:hypothetical protein [Magnetococcales bacterium]